MIQFLSWGIRSAAAGAALSKKKKPRRTAEQKENAFLIFRFTPPDLAPYDRS